MIRAKIRQSLQFFDEYGMTINHFRIEKQEQFAALKHIKPQDIVLELGARYGSVSCIIDKILTKGSNLVSVEPDETVWECLAKNREINDCEFQIVKGLISKKILSLQKNGYGTTAYFDINSKIPHFEIDEIEKKFNLKFNVLVADCEGCFNQFIKENLKFVSELNTIIFEKDNVNKCDYDEVHKILVDSGFTMVENKFISVYKK